MKALLSNSTLIAPAVKTVYSDQDIKNLLDFYEDEHIYLKKVEYVEGKFYFTFRKFDYPYFKSEVTHLTREQTIAFATQAAYMFGIINNIYDDKWRYPLEKFYDYVVNEKMGFTHIDINYRKFTENREDTVMVFEAIKYRSLEDKLFGEISFVLEKYCRGNLKFFIHK